MVPGKETENNFGDVEVGEIDPIQIIVDDVIYNYGGYRSLIA